jgi:hypothetical protein
MGVVIVTLRPQHLVEAGADPVGVFAVLDGDAQGCGGELEVELGRAEGLERAGPVEGLRHSGRLDEVVALAEPLGQADDLLGQRGRDVWGAAADDGQLSL